MHPDAALVTGWVGVQFPRREQGETRSKCDLKKETLSLDIPSGDLMGYTNSVCYRQDRPGDWKGSLDLAVVWL